MKSQDESLKYVLVILDSYARVTSIYGPFDSREDAHKWQQDKFVPNSHARPFVRVLCDPATVTGEDIWTSKTN